MDRTVCLMGVGNVLMGDDALGPYVLSCLQAAYDLPPQVTVFDAGTPGLDLTLFLRDFDALIAVDALQAKGAPGEVKTYTLSQLTAVPLPIVMSPHEPTLREALIRLELLGTGPKEVFLIGAIPQRVETGPGMTPPMLGAVPAIIEQILRELVRLGAPAAPKAVPLPPDHWWELPARRAQS